MYYIIPSLKLCHVGKVKVEGEIVNKNFLAVNLNPKVEQRLCWYLTKYKSCHILSVKQTVINTHTEK